MLWLLFALLAPLLWAATNLIDDDLVLHRLKKPVIILGITGLFACLPALVIILTGHFMMPSWSIILFGLVTGIVSLIAYYPYYRALETANPESVILFWNLAPVLVVLFAFLFLGEQLSLIKYVAIGLLILSAIIVEGSHTDFKPRGNMRALWWMVLGSVVTAIQYTMEKELFTRTTSANGIALICIGSFVSALIILAPKHRRQALVRAFQKNRMILVINHVLDMSAVVCSSLAISLGSVSIVSAIGGIQALFVLGLAWIATRIFTKKQIQIAKAPPFARMAVAVTLSVIGLWVIS